MSWRRVSACAWFALSAGACTALTGIGDLNEVACVRECQADGGTDAADDRAAQDSGTRLDSGDRPRDASLDDAAVEAAPPPFCATQVGAIFCADFDEGQPAAFGWSYATTSGSGSLGVDFAGAASPPGSLLATIAAGPVGGGLEQGLGRETSVAPTSSTHLAFDLFVIALDSAEYSSTATLVFGDPTSLTRYEVSLFLSTGASEILEVVPTDGGFTSPSTALTRSPAPGKWTHVDMDVSVATSRMSVLLDGVVALAPTPLAPGNHGGVVTISVGMAYYSGPGTTVKASSVRIDNVRLDIM